MTSERILSMIWTAIEDAWFARTLACNATCDEPA
jgi:hypothetical protein